MTPVLAISLDWQAEPEFADLVRELEALLAQAPQLVRQGFFDRLPGIFANCAGVELEVVPATGTGECVVVARLSGALRQELRAAATGAVDLGGDCVHGHPSRKVVDCEK